MAGTTWNTFADATKAKASDVNENFDWLEGSIMPHAAGVNTNNAYDLGEHNFKWSTCWIGTSIEINGMTLTSLVDSTTTDLNGFGFVGIRASGARGSTANSGGAQQEILQGSVSYPDFRSQAVSQHAITNASAVGAATTLTSVAITTYGGPVLVFGTMNVKLTANGFGVTQVNCGLYRGTTNISGATVGRTSANNSANAFPVSMIASNVPSASTYTFEMRYEVITGSLTSISDYALTVVELRR